MLSVHGDLKRHTFHARGRQLGFMTSPKTIRPPSAVNESQIDFSSHAGCMKCANRRLQADTRKTNPNLLLDTLMERNQ